MTDDIWDGFPKAVEFTQGKRPMKRSSEKDLDACEDFLGFRLPCSYRSFVKRFGAGILRLDGCTGCLLELMRRAGFASVERLDGRFYQPVLVGGREG